MNRKNYHTAWFWLSAAAFLLILNTGCSLNPFREPEPVASKHYMDPPDHTSPEFRLQQESDQLAKLFGDPTTRHDIIADAEHVDVRLIDPRGLDGKGPLFDAVFSRDKALVSKLLQNDGDVLKLVDGSGPNLTIDRGKSVVDELDVAGWTPLHMAAFHRDHGIASLLIQAKADVNARDSNGRTPLGAVFLTNFGSSPCLSHEEMVSFLIHAGANVDVVDTNGKTPLDYAVVTGWLDMVKTIVEAGAPQNIHSAAMLGHEDVVRKLVNQGSDPNSCLETGYTALHYATEHGHPEIVRYLIANGADVNASTKRRVTPLHNAAFSPNVATYRLLLDNGATLNAITTDGWTPLDYVRHFSHDEQGQFETILKVAGAKISKEIKPTEQSATAADW